MVIPRHFRNSVALTALLACTGLAVPAQATSAAPKTNEGDIRSRLKGQSLASAVWSPDGRKIVYADGSRIKIVDVTKTLEGQRNQ